ncbi:MAG TPA: DUF4139 domain-containing protein [Planktothrix sp.]|jgi:hypothetical protein
MSSKTSTAPQLKSVALTVYPAGFALVQGEYALSLKQGTNHIQLEGMPAQLVQSSLYPDTFAGPGDVTLGPITFRTPNLNPQTLLTRALNQNVTLHYGGNLPHEQQTINGKLLFLSSGTALLLVDGDKVREVQNVKGTTYENVPDGVSNTPALSLTVEASEEGEYTAVLLYTTRGVSWNPEYKFVLDEANSKLTLDGWVVLGNRSGATFNQAKLSVAAGDAGGVEFGGGLESADAPPRAAAMAASAPMGGSAKRANAAVQELGQVKLYDVPGSVTIEEGDSQKVPFYNATEVPVELEYRFPAYAMWHRYRGEIEQQARRLVIIENTEENKLGHALPGAAVTLMQRDNSQRLRQTGTGRLEDLPVGDEAHVDTGEDFDLHLTRKVLETTESNTEALPPANKDDKRPRRKVTYNRRCSVEIFNGKAKPVTVVVEEVTGPDVKLSNQTHGFKQVRDSQFEGTVTIAPHSSETVTYTISETTTEYVNQ